MLAALMWGTVGITTRSLYELTRTNPLSIGFFRLGLAVPPLALACLALLGRQAFQVPRRDLGRMALIGAMMALYQICYFASIQRVGVAVATLVTLCTAPVITAALSAIVLRQRPGRAVLLALACALTGTLLLIEWRPPDGSIANTVGGVTLALGSATGYAVVTLLSRALSGRYHPLQTTTIGFAIGAALLLAAALATGFVAAYPPLGWLRLLYLGLVPTALAYALFFGAMKHVPPTVATIATLLEPLTATILAWLIFGEALSALAVFGAALLLTAMGLLFAAQRAGDAPISPSS